MSSLNGHIGPSQLRGLLSLKWLDYFELVIKHVFLVFVLTSTPNHTPPKDRCLAKKSNQAMPAYLNNVVSLSNRCEILASETIVLIKEDQMDKRREQDK